MRRFAAGVAGFALLSLAAAAPAKPPLESEDQKTLYALGVAVARTLEPFALEPSEVDTLVAGLRESLAGDARLDPQAYRSQIDALGQERQARVAAAEREAAREFVAAAAGEDGARTTGSGLIFRELTAGEGETPGASDRVTVHYHGTLRDGSVFDSSVDRGSPASFGLDRVIPCWTEALQLMREGGKAILTCPAEIAYGDRGAPGGRIRPGAALRFEVELLSVDR